MTTIFRPYSSSDALRSDRSAGDRFRHRQKVRQAIRENISDIISEESIIGKSRDRIIKVPIRGIKEYRFVYGDNAPGVGTGDGTSQPGQVIGQGQGSFGWTVTEGRSCVKCWQSAPVSARDIVGSAFTSIWTNVEPLLPAFVAG